MGAPESIALSTDVPPGGTIDVSVDFVAPERIGVYESIWLLQSPEGVAFGVGPSANQPVWTRVRVVLPARPITMTAPVPLGTSTFSSTPSSSDGDTAYDFVVNACLAQWVNDDGLLPCPGLEGDSRGFVLPVNQVLMENGTAFQLPALLMLPSSSVIGTIQGTYPGYEVQAGDHLQMIVGCEAGFASCSVLFQVAYQDSQGVTSDLWSIGEFSDGQLFNLDLDLAPLASEQVRFILGVSSLGDPQGDRALWVQPRIVHLPGPVNTPEVIITVTPTEALITATPTPTAAPAVPPKTATPIPTTGSGNQGLPYLFQQIVEILVSFFDLLFGK